MTRTVVRRLAVPMVAWLAVAVTACGTPQHIPVALPDTGATLVGTVKYGAEDVNFALVVVQGADGSASAGRIDEDGVYHIPNVPLGEVRVGVNTAAGRGEFQTAAMRAGAMSGSPEGKTGRKKVNVRFVDLPAKYIDPSSSGLATSVNRGENTYHISIPK
jgi:hypothetical protein